MSDLTNGQIVRKGSTNYVVWLFDEDDCENVAATMPSTDSWTFDLLQAAEKLRALDEEPEGRLGLRIVVTERAR